LNHFLTMKLHQRVSIISLLISLQYSIPVRAIRGLQDNPLPEFETTDECSDVCPFNEPSYNIDKCDKATIETCGCVYGDPSCQYECGTEGTWHMMCYGGSPPEVDSRGTFETSEECDPVCPDDEPVFNIDTCIKETINTCSCVYGDPTCQYQCGTDETWTMMCARGNPELVFPAEFETSKECAPVCPVNEPVFNIDKCIKETINTCTCVYDDTYCQYECGTDETWHMMCTSGPSLPGDGPDKDPKSKKGLKTNRKAKKGLKTKSKKIKKLKS